MRTVFETVELRATRCEIEVVLQNCEMRHSLLEALIGMHSLTSAKISLCPVSVSDPCLCDFNDCLCNDL